MSEEPKGSEEVTQDLTPEQVSGLSQEDYERHRAGETVELEETPKPTETDNEPEAPEESQTPEEAATYEEPTKETAESDDEETPKREPRNQRRRRELQRLRDKAEKAEREAAYWRGQAEAKNATPLERPNAEDFDSDEAYDEAIADYVEKKKAADATEQPPSDTQPPTTPEHWVEQEADATERHPDFADVAYAPELPVSDAMFQTILELDEGAEVLYHLGQNREEAARIFQMTDARAVHRALSRIEDGLDLDSPPNGETPKTPRSPAPEPITPIDTGSGAAHTPAEPDLSNMSQEEYERYRFKQMENAY